MMMELVNRRALKQQVRASLKNVQVNATAFTALYLGLLLVLDCLQAVASRGGESNLMTIFATVLTGLLSLVLYAGFTLYCMAVRRGERSEFLTLFDGFAMVGKLIALSVIVYFFISLWSLLFVFPGVVAAYRYRFAFYNLYENPELSPFEALNMSKRQTVGYKYQLFLYDLSYVGWTLLAGLPVLLSGTYGAYTLMSTTGMIAGDVTALPAALAGGLVFALVSSLWSLVVNLFYLPHMVCGELGYFDTAKRTSGVGVDNGPSDFDPPTIHINRPGPDNMGGYNNPDTF